MSQPASWNDLTRDEQIACEVGYEVGWQSGYQAGVRASGGPGIITDLAVVERFAEAVRVKRSTASQEEPK